MVEHRSPKPRVVGSSPSAPARAKLFYSSTKCYLKCSLLASIQREKRIIVTNIFKFIQQSRQEASKIVWPTRRETTTTTIMVFIMVAILATFFLITDSIISFLLRIILSLNFRFVIWQKLNITEVEIVDLTDFFSLKVSRKQVGKSKWL